jgi:plastocyanin
MRSRLYLVPIAALLAACGGSSDSTGPGAGGGGGGGTTAAPVAASVEMSGSKFNPASVRVARGGTVTWTNSDGFAHDVTFDGNPGVANIAAFSTGAKSATMPQAASTIAYHCNIHGAAMSGSIKVE